QGQGDAGESVAIVEAFAVTGCVTAGQSELVSHTREAVLPSTLRLLFEIPQRKRFELVSHDEQPTSALAVDEHGDCRFLLHPRAGDALRFRVDLGDLL